MFLALTFFYQWLDFSGDPIWIPGDPTLDCNPKVEKHWTNPTDGIIYIEKYINYLYKCYFTETKYEVISSIQPSGVSQPLTVCLNNNVYYLFISAACGLDVKVTG